MATVTWLTPAAQAWEQRFGAGTFPAGYAGRAFQALRQHHTPETIGEHLGRYLDETPARYVNLHRFAMTFGDWAPQALVDPATGLLTEYGERRTRPARAGRAA